MAASGVRSSWLASAANRRSRDSLAARLRSAVSTCPSMRLNAIPTWPVSVSGLVSGTPAGRAEGEPDPEHAEHAGERQDGAEDDRLGERDVAELVVLGGQREPGDV